MQTLKDMSVSELEALKEELADAHQQCSRRGIENPELAAMWHAIDEELWSRGA